VIFKSGIIFQASRIGAIDSPQKITPKGYFSQQILKKIKKYQKPLFLQNQVNEEFSRFGNIVNRFPA
jgi:hypothetical protein